MHCGWKPCVTVDIRHWWKEKRDDIDNSFDDGEDESEDCGDEEGEEDQYFHSIDSASGSVDEPLNGLGSGYRCYG